MTTGEISEEGEEVSEELNVSAAATGTGVSSSAFAESGMASAVDKLVAQIRDIYLSDDTPWIVGYSGGKDSTASLQLVWMTSFRVVQKRRRTVQLCGQRVTRHPGCSGCLKDHSQQRFGIAHAFPRAIRSRGSRETRASPP